MYTHTARADSIINGEIQSRFLLFYNMGEVLSSIKRWEKKNIKFKKRGKKHDYTCRKAKKKKKSTHTHKPH